MNKESVKELQCLINKSKEALVEINDYVDVNKNINKLREYCEQIKTIFTQDNSFAQVHLSNTQEIIDRIETIFNIILPYVKREGRQGAIDDFNLGLGEILFNIINIEREFYYFDINNEEKG